MARRKKTLQEQIDAEADEIRREIAHWCYMREYGCSDPSCPDGVNMNLTRNHVIYGKRRLEELCAEAGVDLPEEYYLPAPPKVSKRYVADITSDRAKQLMCMYPVLVIRKPENYPEQGSMF